MQSNGAAAVTLLLPNAVYTSALHECEFLRAHFGPFGPMGPWLGWLGSVLILSNDIYFVENKSRSSRKVVVIVRYSARGEIRMARRFDAISGHVVNQFFVIKHLLLDAFDEVIE